MFQCLFIREMFVNPKAGDSMPLHSLSHNRWERPGTRDEQSPFCGFTLYTSSKGPFLSGLILPGEASLKLAPAAPSERVLDHSETELCGVCANVSISSPTIPLNIQRAGLRGNFAQSIRRAVADVPRGARSQESQRVHGSLGHAATLN
jgi:hypothetical protein